MADDPLLDRQQQDRNFLLTPAAGRRLVLRREPRPGPSSNRRGGLCPASEQAHRRPSTWPLPVTSAWQRISSRRFLIAIPILFGITVLIFVFVALAPGDPVDAYLRPEMAGNAALREPDRRTARVGPAAPDPLPGLAGADAAGQPRVLGRDRRAGQPDRLDGLLASGVTDAHGTPHRRRRRHPLGVMSALRQYSQLDFGLTGIAFLGISTPSLPRRHRRPVHLRPAARDRPDRRHADSRRAVHHSRTSWRTSRSPL